jgi:hypothetical protein
MGKIAEKNCDHNIDPWSPCSEMKHCCPLSQIVCSNICRNISITALAAGHERKSEISTHTNFLLIAAIHVEYDSEMFGIKTETKKLSF